MFSQKQCKVIKLYLIFFHILHFTHKISERSQNVRFIYLIIKKNTSD